MKERILETADRLFYLQGIRAVGVDTIAAEIGISKRTLYNHFPSKDALISAYLERRFVQPRPSDKPPAEQILATFDSLERRFASKDFRGCPFVNAVAELGAEDRAVQKIAIAFKESRRIWFRDLLMQLGVADAEGLATQLTLLVDGSIAQDLVRDDPSMARAAKEAARVLLMNAGIGNDGSDILRHCPAALQAEFESRPSRHTPDCTREYLLHQSATKHGLGTTQPCAWRRAIVSFQTSIGQGPQPKLWIYRVMTTTAFQAESFALLKSNSGKPMSDEQSIQSRLDFIGIDNATREALHELQPLIASALPGILDRFTRRS